MHWKYIMIHMEIQSGGIFIKAEQQIYCASITSKGIQKQKLIFQQQDNQGSITLTLLFNGLSLGLYHHAELNNKVILRGKITSLTETKAGRVCVVFLRLAITQTVPIRSGATAGKHPHSCGKLCIKNSPGELAKTLTTTNDKHKFFKGKKENHCDLCVC